MFDIANDRLSYSELLRPDIGYKLDFAIGTTYSLDLEALLGVPVSLGLLDDTDSEHINSPLYVLEAIRTGADKIAIFCNAGGIKLPNRIQSVYSLLEESVFQVKHKSGNFHPKLWILKYINEERESYIKLLVMSRNLTFDTSIDLCVSMRGEVKRARRLKNKPLADMLDYLSKYATKSKQQKIKEVAEDLLHVSAFDVDLPFEDYTFLPIGIPGYMAEETKLFDHKYDLFIASPFLSDDIVCRLTENVNRKILVTRKSSVTEKTMGSFDHVYITKDVLSDNEFGTKQDIHAKLYFTSTYEGNYLYIGSANASHNAFYRNIECLLKLKYKSGYIGMKTFVQDFIPNENSPYEELTCIPEAASSDSEQKLIDAAIREAVFALKRADVVSSGSTYTVTVKSQELKAAEEVFISPLQRPDLATLLEPQVEFRGMLLKELGEFFVLKVRDQSVVVKVDTHGIPKERDQAIYRSIIDSKAKFMSYLSFVLAENSAAATSEMDAIDRILVNGSNSSHDSQVTSAVYEKMLKVFHQNPYRLKGVSDMMRRLDPDIVGEEFVQMFEQFEIAAKKVQK